MSLPIQVVATSFEDTLAIELECIRNQSWNPIFTLTDETGNLIDISGYQLVLTVVALNYDGTLGPAVWSSTNFQITGLGVAQFSIPSSLTGELSVDGAYKWFLQSTPAGGAGSDIVLGGPVIINDSPVSVSGGGSGGIPEAPTDGQLYGRKNSGWSVVNWVAIAGKPVTFPPDATAELVAHKDQPNGYPSLDATGKVPVSELPAMSASDPTKVLKSGDTMTGTLLFSGINGDSISIDDSASTSQGFTIAWPAGGWKVELDCGHVTISSNVWGTASLSVNSTGDLVVSAPNGPHAGKSANLTSGKWNQAQISFYDDFDNCNLWNSQQPIGTLPGAWVLSGSGNLAGVLPTGAQNGILSIAPGQFVVSNFLGASALHWPIAYNNISKIVARFVFCLTQAVSFGAGNEAVVGFTHTGLASADGSNNLYGAYINYCPGYANLPDWDTRAIIVPAGFTYGVYAGQSTSGFGYKNSSIVTANVANNAWYEGIISMVPGVSCAFYIAPYGSAPALDRTCTVTSLITKTVTAGPLINMGGSSGIPGAIQIDKVQYAIWFTEGNKALTDDQLYAL